MQEIFYLFCQKNLQSDEKKAIIVHSLFYWFVFLMKQPFSFSLLSFQILSLLLFFYSFLFLHVVSAAEQTTWTTGEALHL
jgi:hypothetical protein